MSVIAVENLRKYYDDVKAVDGIGFEVQEGEIFGFEVVPNAAWLAVAAMVIVFPIIHGTEMALRFFRQVQEKEWQEKQLKALAADKVDLLPLNPRPAPARC